MTNEATNKSPDPSRISRLGSAPARLKAGAVKADNLRVVVTQKAVLGLAVAVTLLRIPSFLVLLAPVAPAVALVVLAFFADGSLRWLLLVVATLIFALAFAFGRRRRELLTAVTDPADLSAEFVQAFSATGVWSRVQPQLAALAEGIDNPRRPLQVLRQWRVLLSIAGELLHGLDRYPRVAPFGPASLRNTWLLGIVCLVAAFGGTVLAIGAVILLAISGL